MNSYLWNSYRWLHPWTPYRREGRWHYIWLHPWTSGGTMDDFIHGRHRERETKGSSSCQHKSWRRTASWNHVVVLSWRKNAFGCMQFDANEKHQHIEIDKTTAWIMATYVLHIASGLFFRIGVSDCVLVFINTWFKNCSWMLHTIENFMQEQGKQKLESNSTTQSFLNESFEAFVD
jgi:hypothetical protein